MRRVVCPGSSPAVPRERPAGFSDKAFNPSTAPRRAIVRLHTGPACREIATWLAKESGIDTPWADNLGRPGRVRKGKKCSKED
jgi:hypothetical protein